MTAALQKKQKSKHYQQNINLTPEQAYKLKVYAASRNCSLASLVRERFADVFSSDIGAILEKQFSQNTEN